MFLRGREGPRLRRVSTKGARGWRAALGLVWPQVLIERGGAHKLRNIAAKVAKKAGACLREAAVI